MLSEYVVLKPISPVCQIWALVPGPFTQDIAFPRSSVHAHVMLTLDMGVAMYQLPAVMFRICSSTVVSTTSIMDWVSSLFVSELFWRRLDAIALRSDNGLLRKSLRNSSLRKKL